MYVRVSTTRIKAKIFLLKKIIMNGLMCLILSPHEDTPRVFYENVKNRRPLISQ